MSDQSTRRRARALCRRAEESGSELQRVELANQALSLWEGCPDAHLLLGRVTDGPEEARPHFERALARAREAIGEDEIEDWEGELAYHEHGISYLRALDALALVAIHTGEEADDSREEAASYLREVLRLDSEDHLGASHTLLAHLIGQNEPEADEEAQELVEAHPCECSQYLYSEALLAYRLGLDEDYAEELLCDAILIDPYVPAFMLGAMELPDEPPDPEDFEEDETAAAAVYAASSLEAWLESPGSLDWMRSCLMQAFEEIREDLMDEDMLERIFAGAEDAAETEIIRVLIADSEPVRQLGIRLALESSGAFEPGTFDPYQAQTGEAEGYRTSFEVHAIAPDAGSAFQAAADMDFDVAIVDVIMRMDATEVDTGEFNGVVIPGGFSLAYNLKHGREDLGIEPTKVLLLGEYEDEAEPDHQLRYTEADGYVDARVSVDKLVAAVRGVCAGEEVRQGV